jgi:sigma-B regulation protein RsbU (phosphoserine phosphatase)
MNRWPSKFAQHARCDIVTSMRPRTLLAVGFLLFAACAPFAGAQTRIRSATQDELNPRHFDAFLLGQRVDLGPDWLFSPDDNPAYTSPTFDDSAWKTVSLNKQLTDYGIHNIPYAWYRIHVHVNPRWNNLAVEVQYITGSYELYVNGVRIGANGKMVGMLKSNQDYLTAYEIPDSMIAPNGDLVISIRFAINKMGDGTPGTSTPLTANCIFLTNREATTRDAGYEATHQTATYFILFGLNLVVGIVALALYLAMRSQAEYLAISIALLATSLQSAVMIWGHLHAATTAGDFLEWIAIGIVGVANIEFVRLIAHLRRTRWLLAMEITLFLSDFVPPLAYSALWMGSSSSAHASFLVPSLINAALLPVLLIWSARRGNRDARFFIPPFAFIGFLNAWNSLGALFFILHLPQMIPFMPNFHFAGYGFSLWDVWNVVYGVTMLLFLVLRTIGIARERAHAAAELEAARTVQQVLIPQEIPSVPGFAIQSVYKPAGQVGGDFFQILPVHGGGVLVVIGDVSGKGMPAAMTVSLLVGTVRTLAHYTESPGEILAAMNQRMLARSHGGFTTCLVLRCDAGGQLTIANAGHIAPYLAGKELPLENGLPLGLAAETTYTESKFQLGPGDHLTLLSDGVVEARDKAGSLFGFERSAALSTQSADAIASAAEAFGQDDDITVLTLSFAAVPAIA